MQTSVYTIKMERKDDVYCLEPLGDVHLGNKACDKDHFFRRVKAITEDPLRYTLFMGDLPENNGPTSRGAPNPHFRIADLDPDFIEVADQTEAVVDVLKPIAKKSLGAHIGNHEDRTMTEKEFQLFFCKPLEVKYLGYAAMTRLKFEHRGKEVASYVILSEHSRLSGQRKGTIMNNLEQLFRLYDADLILAGHTHFKFVDEMIRYVWDFGRDTIAEKTVLAANTGSFVKSHVEGYSAYTDRNLGSSRQTGTITIRFDPYNQKLNHIV